jgi:hypothetical protein
MAQSNDQRNTVLAVVMLVLIVGMFSCKHEPPVMPEEPFTIGGGGPGGGGMDPDPCDPTIVFFQQQVLPILISNCAVPGCHNQPTDDNDDIEITSYGTLMGSDILDPSDPFDSDFWEVITDTDPDNRMPQPPQNPLTAAQLALIQQWLQQGAQNNSCENALCDTTNITYAATIRPIIQAKCQGCHSGPTPQGGLDYTSWNTLNTVASDGRLEGAIRHLPTFVAMPPSGPALPDCQVDQFLIWIDAGAPNN